MKKKIASILAVALLATNAFSQAKVSGVVKDAKGRIINFINF